MRLLIVEGNSEEIITGDEALGSQAAWKSYREALQLHAPEAEFDVSFPYAPARAMKLSPFGEYDGIVLTGSGVAWGAETEEARPYVSLLEKLLDTGKPVLGSCWGIQTAAVALGGMSGINPRGSEIGLARRITLTAEGKRHKLFEGMPERFNSPCWHRDHVTRLPDGAELLASNEVSEVQAFAYDRNGVDYMGFQFHPENRIEEFAAYHARRKVLPGTVGEIVDFPDTPPAEVADAMVRTRPIGNWIGHVRQRMAR